MVLFSVLVPWMMLAVWARPGLGLPTVTRFEVDAQRALENLRRELASSPLEGVQRDAATAHLDAASASERGATELREQIASLRAEAAESSSRRDEGSPTLELDPAQALAEWSARLSADADSEALEDLLDRQRDVDAGLTEELELSEAELAGILMRPIETARQMAELRRQIDAFSEPLASSEEEPALLTEARRLRAMGELHRAQAELELHRVEQETSLERQRLYERKIHDLRLRRTLSFDRIRWLQARVAEKARVELEHRVRRLTETPTEKVTGETIEATFERNNRALGDEILEQSDRLASDREKRSSAKLARERVATALEDSRTRIELGGASAGVGRWLWSERRRLEPTARVRRRLEDIQGELAELRLRRVVQSEDQRRLADIPDAARALRESSEVQAADEGRLATGGDALEPLLRRRVELFALYEPILQRRIETLEEIELAVQEQLDLTQTLRQLLDRHLLWIPSHPPMDSSWLGRAPEGLSDLLKTSRWITTAGLVRDEIVAHPVVTVAGVLLLLLLLELRRRAPERILAQAAITRQIGEDHIGVTLTAFAWTLLAALPGPAVLTAVGELLQRAGTPGRYSDSLGRACAALVLPLLSVQLLGWTAIENGLGHAHFRWMRARREAIRHVLPRAAAIVLPLFFVTALAFIRNLDLPNDVQARLAVVLSCVVLAWAFWRLLDVGQIWVQRGVETEPSMIRRLLRVALPFGAAVVAVLAVAGYVYSADVLFHATLASIGVLIAVSLAVGVLGRWFLLGERRLALRQAEERRSLAGQNASAEGGAPREIAPEITLEQVSAQTRSLLRALRIGLLVVGLVWVWATVLPAITRLDEVTLWSFGEMGPDGVPIDRPVSLMAVLFGLTTLALTVIGSRNLPGLIELGLLSQTRIDAASRYAISSLLRYAIAITGTVVGVQLLGMRWSQVQWMAAALTVGLGFGLQEIFANFVSGLILLIERPFRVGDVISVGDLSGRVTRIRTRATTILDFDAKEIVVPNKNFITGLLLNWTLSDTTTRIVAKVGVAYGTDPDRVHALLLEVASANPRILREPVPQSQFVAFGASALEFELRVFVGTLPDRQLAQNELHRDIARVFAENQIEIAFPQLDVHVRDRTQETPPAAPPTRG
ncbi:MAG: mechanosensitive ion channel [Deltaproteobacteria bacterium]|nr:mechanosensitive ion channel [Deltaproteobacteria bacterium]